MSSFVLMFGTTLPYVEKSGVEEGVWKVEAAPKRHATDRFSKKALAEVRKFNFCSDFLQFYHTIHVGCAGLLGLLIATQELREGVAALRLQYRTVVLEHGVINLRR